MLKLAGKNNLIKIFKLVPLKVEINHHSFIQSKNNGIQTKNIFLTHII